MKAVSNAVLRVFCAFLSTSLVVTLCSPASAKDIAPERALPSAYIAPETPSMFVPNPAVAYCEGLGYATGIVKGEEGEHVVCHLPDGRRVDAWSFFRGDVAPEYSWCAKQGLGIRKKVTDHGDWVSECAVCVSEDGEELGTVAELSGLQFDSLRGIMPSGDEDSRARTGPREPGVKPRRRAVSFGGSPPMGAVPSWFDWRTQDGTTAVKAQGSCGSCWAFSTVGAMECNILIKDAVEVDLSEQYLVSCNDDGWSCGGGGFAHAYHFLKSDFCGGVGAVLETDFPYQASDVPCDCPYPHAYQLESWGFIPRVGDFPSDEAIKWHIMNYGPVSVGVLANSSFSSYVRGVYYGSPATTINHAVVLVGWDDNQGYDGVWFLRNSWGTMWGEQGYMRIAYGANAVGFHANWVEYRDPVRIVVTDAPTGVLAPGEPVTVTVRIEEHSDECMPGTAVMHCSVGSGRFEVVPLEPVGDDLYQATIPAAACGDTVTYYFSATGMRYGTVYNPREPLSDPFRCLVGYEYTVFADDFETDTGWTVSNGPELSGGAWERGVPLGGGDRSDPPTDCDGSGSCFLTENVDGNSDVDKDYTRLKSPIIDLSGGDEAVVDFAYWYRNDRGDNPNCDYFVTSLSNDGGATWVPADTIGPRAPLPVGWHRRCIVVGEHVPLTDQVRIRFQVADDPGGSLVEAGVDDVTVSLLSCDSTGGDSVADPMLRLLPNAPNPFGSGTVISYELHRAADVKLTIHNASGRVVRTLVSGVERGEGPHAVRWDGRDDGGRNVAAGVYFYKLEADGETLTAKMILLR